MTLKDTVSSIDYPEREEEVDQEGFWRVGFQSHEELFEFTCGSKKGRDTGVSSRNPQRNG